jgi:hypothetical protein
MLEKGVYALLWGVAAVSLVAAPGAASDFLTPERLERVNVSVESVVYRGAPAVRMVEVPGASPDAETLAVVPGTRFRDGTLEIEVAGAPRAGAEAGGARGFVGVAFRLQKDPLRYECFYLRPTNGRADDQLRRNHTTQYVSHPDHPWHRLRKESPGIYESYVDLVPGEWTRVKIVVSGRTARLYVHGAEQPSLIVNDLKLEASEGAVALWIGPGTEAHFANLRVERRQP